MGETSVPRRSGRTATATALSRVAPDPESIPLAFVEASPNAVVGVDADGEIVYVNPQAERTFGYVQADLVGQPVEMLLPERVATRHLKHRRRFTAQPRARPMGIGLDLAGRRRDGSEFPVEISLSPVQTALGIQVFATVVDITSRKEAEARLAASERRFRTVLDATPNPVVGIDVEGRIMYVNPEVERAFGYAPDEILGKRVEVLLPTGVRERHVAHREGYVANPASRPMGIGLDLAGRRKDGSEFPAEISLSPVETSSGYEVFASIVDITGRKIVANELLQAQKLESIGRLAGGIAHDFNNVLFAIGGYAELLEEDLGEETPLDRPAAMRSTAAIAQAVHRAQELTGQLLSFSRQQVVQPRIVDLNDAIDGIEPMLHRLIGANIRLVRALAQVQPKVHADPGQLDQILINLAVNARDAMPDGGTLTISTGISIFDARDAAQHADMSEGTYAYLAVADTGEGMDHETRQHIFEPFFTTKERGKGTGLGLATIYGIVRQAAGHIWVYSEIGQGSVFKLYFPLAEGSVPLAEPALEPGAEDKPNVGFILLVEDDPDVRDMTGQLLERAGYVVIPAPDGPTALEIIGRGEPFDALVTDVIMPGMSGIELTERVTATRSDIGAVLLSGYTEETLDLDRLRERHVSFVSKPVSGKELLRAVGAAIAQARSR